MLILVLGVALWWGAHLFRRLAPAELRARLGTSEKPVVAVLLAVSVVLMVLGYRAADGAVFWGPSPALKGINNLLVLVAFYLFAAAGMKTGIARRFRHPQLAGFALWAFAHLLVNGDVPSFVLFGGLLVWALVEMVVINRADPGWTPSLDSVPASKEIRAAAGAVVVFLVVGLIHMWLGYNPFGA